MGLDPAVERHTLAIADLVAFAFHGSGEGIHHFGGAQEKGARAFARADAQQIARGSVGEPDSFTRTEKENCFGKGFDQLLDRGRAFHDLLQSGTDLGRHFAGGRFGA